MPEFNATTEPKPSSLPEDLFGLLAKYDPKKDGPSEEELKDLETFQRACNYLSVAQIFLVKAPISPEKEMTKDWVKKRLLGHFGTCPGLALVFAHVNLMIQKIPEAKFMIVTGPGHGAPAVLSALYLEGSITRFYPKYSMDKPGFDRFVKAFSWPGGFPSHVNAETPGQIHEGGELGYALAVSYGAVMDNPDLIVPAIIGDGEAETGPTATAWHAHKFIDPKESGAVLPILHVNGFKISERTIFGTMDDKEAAALFTGYGYQIAIVEYDDVTNTSPEADRKVQIDFHAALLWAYREIRTIQKAAREDKPIVKPRWPMIFLRTPKGWTGPKQLHGLPLVNSFRSHQVPLTAAGKDDEQFEMLKNWLASYHPESLFDPSSDPFVKNEVTKIVPKDESRRLGIVKDAWANHKPLDVPVWLDYASEKGHEISAMKAVAKLLEDVIEKNPETFRIFSPDELASNKLDSVLEKTNRNFQWDPETANRNGRVIEMLSEHTLQGFLQGYTLTGRTGLFPSYEAFLPIVTSMIEQYSKFIKVAKETTWRQPISSLNYVDTSTLWRQEHNGYSHQAPGLINSLLLLPHNIVRVYLPPDGNTALSCMAHCLRSQNYVNLIVGSKQPTPQWLGPEEADRHCIAGASVWREYSTDEGKDPDVVLVGIGVEVTTEVVHAAALLRRDAPGLRVRVVNVIDLLVLDAPGDHPHALDEHAFNALFTADKPVVVNYHGYPAAVKQLLFGRKQSLGRSRFSVLGYIEEGTTTTPFSLLRVNRASRFHVAEEALRGHLTMNPNTPLSVVAHELISNYQHQNRKHEQYTVEHGADPPELEERPKF